MALASKGTGGNLDGLVAEVFGDFTNPAFDPADPDANASVIEVPGATDGEQRNQADDIRTAVRDRLLAAGVTPPAGLTLRSSRDGSVVTFYYGNKGQKTRPEHVGPTGSTGRVTASE